jgi:hypothetical protein
VARTGQWENVCSSTRIAVPRQFPPFFLGKLLILGYIRLAPAPRQTSPGYKIKLPI